MAREYSDYIEDILIAMDKASSFIEGINFDDFKSDDKTIFAVVRAIEIIGEATKHIPEDARQKYSEIPWKEMAGMRDVLIHDYISVDVETVWLTANNKIPQIRPLIDKMAKELE
ncbi:MAG: DUF86 domain-containing protein [Nitrospirota bacterium]